MTTAAKTIYSGVIGYDLRLIPASPDVKETRYIVVRRRDNREIGLLTKYRNTRTESFPVHAYAKLPAVPGVPSNIFYPAGFSKLDTQDALQDATAFVVSHNQ